MKATILGLAARTRHNQALRGGPGRVRVLREMLLTKTARPRITFTDDQRLRLALKGKALTPEERSSCCQIVRPDTLLKWFRQLAAKKYGG
jgi:hypothetical protein